MSRNPKYIRLINTYRWRALRAEKLKNNPVCEQCERTGKSTLATEVHHIVPVESVPTIRQMEVLTYTYDNLMSVCHECHVEIHEVLNSHTKEHTRTSNKKKTQSFAEKYL